MRSISKEFKKYKINAVRITKVNGEVIQEPVSVETYETVTVRNAVATVKKLKKYDKKEIIFIDTISETVEKYTMSGEDFLKYATKQDIKE